ncbi:hypothetical protein [Mucilaginibacter psychrotolerans]|uniref:Uncharacterized protein n=1 Tax=Mucilaginibacter psychrotolerans TaxID=1524096 RepID=A0A4Y8SAF7_9SPHI|nr:hypothetical protein [Mucilaginibacter psychrotolerans]TFF35424.1 hypothetical protein E2R66_19405 [Mucilaginibacter psychrotolerans]
MKKKVLLLICCIAMAITVSTRPAFAVLEESTKYDTAVCKQPADGGGSQHTGSWCDPPLKDGPCTRQSDCH